MGIKVTVKPLNGHPVYKYRVFYPDGEKRKTKNFRLKREAQEWAKEKLENLTKSGTADSSITKEERNAIMRFRIAAAEMGIEGATLTEAVDHYLEHLNLNFKSLTCEEVTDSLIHRLDKAGKSKRHIDGTRNRLDRFNAEYGDRMASDISTEIIDDFLTHLGVAPITTINYRLALSGMFAHAVRLKAAQANPVKEAIKPEVEGDEPGILKPKQVAALLCAASERVLPALAISFFAGLRRSEIEKLNWSEVDFDEMHIEIKANIAKKKKRRFVPMSENLAAWLLPHAESEKPVVQSPQIFRKGMEDARSAAGITEWPSNAGRHSFASYYLAEHQDAGKTAFALGHPDPTLLYDTYRALVKAKDAHTYWSIVPGKASNITDIKAS